MKNIDLYAEIYSKLKKDLLLSDMIQSHKYVGDIDLLKSIIYLHVFHKCVYELHLEYNLFSCNEELEQWVIHHICNVKVPNSVNNYFIFELNSLDSKFNLYIENGDYSILNIKNCDTDEYIGQIINFFKGKPSDFYKRNSILMDFPQDEIHQYIRCNRFIKITT